MSPEIHDPFLQSLFGFGIARVETHMNAAIPNNIFKALSIITG